MICHAQTFLWRHGNRANKQGARHDMLNTFHRIPLLLLVIIAAGLATLVYLTGATGFFVANIGAGQFSLNQSIASLAKASLFAPLKPLMYALIIMSIGSSLAISHGGLGAKFVRVFAFFITFSTIGAIVCIAGYTAFSHLTVLADPASLDLGSGASITQIPFAAKIYSVITSELMFSIYAGIIFGQALKKLDLGEKADQASDLFQNGFRKFLQFTIPLAVFGSITLALSRPGGVETLSNLIPFVGVYMLTFGIVWVIMMFVTSLVLGKSIGFVFRGVFPQAVVALSTSSSIATLPATKVATSQLGANGDEATPFFTIGATINMVGTLMGLTLLSLYAMGAYGLEVSMADRIIVALQSLIYSVSAAGVPSASVVLLGDILTSQGVSAEYATYVTGLIITVDTLILDRLRTALNTQSDSMSTAMGLHVYYKKPAILGET